MENESLVAVGENEEAIVLITRDDEGEYVARDLTRPGCLIHGMDETEALLRLMELRPFYDNSLGPQK